MITAKAYINSDDCYLAWTMPYTKGCMGFAIFKELVTAAGKKYPKKPLRNYTGFEGQKEKPGESRDSTAWPFQRYTWTDHSINEGDTVTYTIVPVMKTGETLRPDEKASVVLGPLRAVSSGDGSTRAYFNRGLLLSQFMTTHLKPDWDKNDLKALKEQLGEDDNELRRFLMGQLGARLDALLEQATREKWHVYAALYELEDKDLVGHLKTLGPRAHLVLSNGSSPKKGTDGNAAAAATLGDSVDLHRRMLWSEGLGHNKFVVFAKRPGDPFLVWTGSLNWTPTGLCTQLNNSILIEDPAVAGVYLRQWELLRDDHRTGRGGSDMHFGEALMASNNEPKAGTGPAGDWTVWFTRTGKQQDLAALYEVIDQAEEAILFVLFEPGQDGILQRIQARAGGKKKIYVQGVVNTLKTGKGTGNLNVNLVSPGRKEKPFDLDIVQPEGIDKGLAGWAHEIMRRDFLATQGGAIGFAITHSKMIVTDPRTNPVVVTGSHNMSQNASKKNDENIVIVRGDRGLAERYAVNIMGVYEHYLWRAAVSEARKSGRTIETHDLDSADTWQIAKLKSGAEKLAFWTGTA